VSRPATEVLYARLPAGLVGYVRAQAQANGLSMAQVTAFLLAYCREHGITVAPLAAGGHCVRAASGTLARRGLV
jgi:hypothetical protein